MKGHPMGTKAEVMETKSSTISDFAKHEQNLIEGWDCIQRYQTDFCFALELPSYYEARQWQEAKKVIDLGTGNGYYLNNIIEHFPDKQYHGVDLSPSLVETAMREINLLNARFTRCDIHDLDGSYDFVIVRLLLQHLRDAADDALKKIADITKRGGSALIIDPHDEARLYSPELPHFMRFFQAYSDYQLSLGLDRSVAMRLPQIIERHPYWKIGSFKQVVIPSALPGNLDLFRRIYSLFIDLVEHSSDMRYDFEIVKREWAWWCSLDHAYTQAGLTIVRLDRI